jgi:1-phosphofructokinase
MIHLVTLNPALDLSLLLQEPHSGKIGKLPESGVEAGGKALNIARFLKGSGTAATLWLGTGGGDHPTHVLYRSLLKKEGLAARFLSAQAPIRMNAVLESHRHAKKYNHPGHKLPSGLFVKLLPAVARTNTVVLTGRLPKGMKDSTYSDWIGVFNRRDIRTVVDTSGKALKSALAAKPWFFKVNCFELSEALGRKFASLADVTRAIPSFLKSGLAHGAVTHGAQGALLWKEGEVIRVSSSQKIGRAFVVGAGDGFLAGYLKGIDSKMSFVDSAKLACATATVVAMKGIMGFDAGSVAEQLKKVRIKKIT